MRSSAILTAAFAAGAFAIPFGHAYDHEKRAAVTSYEVIYVTEYFTTTYGVSTEAGRSHKPTSTPKTTAKTTAKTSASKKSSTSSKKSRSSTSTKKLSTSTVKTTSKAAAATTAKTTTSSTKKSSTTSASSKKTTSTSASTKKTTTSKAAAATSSTAKASPVSASTSVSTSSVASSTTSTAAAVPTTYEEIVIYHHNIHRANHSADDVTWSTSLAATAADIAATCDYAHNITANGGGYGQNIAAGVEANNVSAIITDLFYNGEVGWFDGLYGEAQPDMTNFEHWGHFSQIVWKGTTQVGCATQDCSASGLSNVGSDVAPYFTVCNYEAPGNYANEYGANIGSPLGDPTASWDTGL